MLYSGLFLLIFVTTFVAVQAQMGYRYKSLPPNCGFTHQGSFEKICSGKYPLDVSIRYRDGYIEPGMPYAIYRSKLLEDVYFFSFLKSELHQCHNFFMKASTPSDFQCLDGAPAEDEEVNKKPTEKPPATFKVNRTRGGRRHKWGGSKSSEDSPEDSKESPASQKNQERGGKRHKLKPMLTGNLPELVPLNGSLSLGRRRRQTNWEQGEPPVPLNDNIFTTNQKSGTTTNINPLNEGPSPITLSKAVLYCFHFDIHIADELLKSCFKDNKQKFKMRLPKKVVMHYTLETRANAATPLQPALAPYLIVLLIGFEVY